MADADVLPEDEVDYAEAIRGYLVQAQTRASARGMNLDFAPVLAAADSYLAAAHGIHTTQLTPPADDVNKLNKAILSAEHALVLPDGLPLRPWYRQEIYAPGLATGYAPEVLPGVSDAIDSADAPRAQEQLAKLVAALGNAASLLQVAVR